MTTSLLESYSITPDGGSCELVLRNEDQEELRVRLGVLEARALSDALMSVAAKMQLARQGGRSVTGAG
jgi:hypothetical protein